MSDEVKMQVSADSADDVARVIRAVVSGPSRPLSAHPKRSRASQVTDNGGEVSASVEETNRVRAQLGLAPLREGGGAPSKESMAIANGRERAEAMEKESQEEALRDKFEATRRQRLLHQKLSGKSLGEQLAGESMDSAAAWVAKSRDQEAERKERRKEARARKAAGGGRSSVVASQSARYDEEDEMAGGASELAGALVGHSAEDFKAGESVVLTLADQSLVAEGEDGRYGLNEEGEMLENVNMTEEWRRKHNKAMANGEGRYRAYESGDTSVLNKYDDEPGRATMTLDTSGGVDEGKLKRLAEIKARLAASQAGGGGERSAYDLSGPSGGGAAVRDWADGSDYQTRAEAEAEAAAFRKPGKTKKLRKKVKPERSAGLDLDAMAAETAASAGAADHASAADRAARVREREAASASALAENRNRFDRALASAEERSAQTLRQPAAGSNEADAAGVDGGGGAEEVAEEEAEVDAELYAALARARRLTSKPASKVGVDDGAAIAIAERVAVREASGGGEEEEVMGVELSAIEFSETGEFCKAVRSKEETEAADELPSAQFRRRQKESAGAAKTEVTREVKVEHGTGSEGVKEEEDEEEESDEEEGGGGGAAGASFLYERNASSGMGAVLDMARNRGMLGDEAISSGRMFDQKGAGLHAYDDESKDKDFNLDYFDEYGRKMTQKQAFRQLSWKFHGKMPSKKNREKRMLEAEKQLADKSEDKAMAYMSALKHAQQSTKSAHVVLTGIHAIKPSDIKSKSSAAASSSNDRPKKKAKQM